MPAKAYRYAIPKDLYNEHYIRRYGFMVARMVAYVSHRADSLFPHNQTQWLDYRAFGQWLLVNRCI